MSIKLHLPKGYSSITKGKEIFELDGETVGECLSQFVTLFPRMKDELFYSGTREGESLATDGKLWSKIKVTVNGESIDAGGLATKVKSGDMIEIETTGHP